MLCFAANLHCHGNSHCCSSIRIKSETKKKVNVKCTEVEQNAVTYPKFYTTSLVALSVGFTHPLITVKVKRRQKRLVNEAI